MPDPSQILWTAGFLNERFPAPVSPLGWSVLGPLFENYALREPLRFMGYPEAEQIPATRLVRGHPYANALIFQILYNPFPKSFMPSDAVRYFPEGAVSFREMASYPRSVLNPRFLASMIAHFLRDPINWSPLNFWQWQRYTRQHDRRVVALNMRLDRTDEPAEILEVIADANRVHADLLKIHRWSLTYADLLFRLLTLLVGDSAQALIADVPNLTWQLDQDLQALSILAAKLGLPLDSDEAISAARASPEFDDAVKDLLKLHGHRSFCLDIAQPTFADEPGLFLRLLQSNVQFRPIGPLSQGTASPTQLPLYGRALFNILLGLARRYAALREDQRYYWQKSLAATRRAYLMLGRRLVDQRLIALASDIFYATAAEVAAYFKTQLSGQELALAVQGRRKAWEKYQEEYIQSPASAYPAFLRGDASLDSAPPSRGNSWQGRGVSPGQARGKARVILDARDLVNVLTGEVLIAPATDPGWTPVFSRLSALVVERGGVLAHSAIVAREHRLPAVAGVTNITRELADGDWIEVDGTSGVVRRIEI